MITRDIFDRQYRCTYIAAMKPDPQKALLAALKGLIGPIVQFLLDSGLGFREFSQIAKSEFVLRASRAYGVRGRPTNVSRVAVITGLTRKEVRSIRESSKEFGDEQSSDMDRVNPATVVLHAWHSDPDFLGADGQPRSLAASGDGVTFATLCRRYAGDIPSGAMLSELRRVGSVGDSPGGRLRPLSRYYTPSVFDDRFVGSMAFSLGNLARTLVNNAMHSRGKNPSDLQDFGLFERYVWTSRLSEKDTDEFKRLAELRSEQLLAELDAWIGARETAPVQEQGEGRQKKTKAVVGLGLYLFEKDPEDDRFY